MTIRHKVRHPLALAVSAALLTLSSGTGWADEAAASVELKTAPTGSRLATAQDQATAALTVIDRDTLLRSGATSLADFLRNTPFNSFGSLRPQSGTDTPGLAEFNLHGLGSQRSLILIDGRRAPRSPTNGRSQDLNSIPLAAVERIEILTQGAAAIYGSDASGGVVNIITRRAFNGVEISLGAGHPTRSGGETEQGSVIFGVSSERGTLMTGVSYHNRGIYFDRDRDYSRGGLSTFSANLLGARAVPGTPITFTPGSFVAHPSNGSVLPGFDCRGNGFLLSGTGSASRCLYDFSQQSAAEAELRNEALFSRGNYMLNDDWVLHLNTSVARVKSFGRDAPVPSSPWPGGLPMIPVGSPNHPAVRFPNAGYVASQPYFLRHRFAAVGPLDTSSDLKAYDLNLGLQGRIGDVELDAGLRHNEQRLYELGRNRIATSIAQQFIADGRYDIYRPFDNPRAVLEAMSATSNRDARTEQQEVFANASLPLFALAGGQARAVLGVEFGRERADLIYDTLQTSGQTLGNPSASLIPPASLNGQRKLQALYGELLLPLWIDSDIRLALRRDDFEDLPAETSAQLALSHRLGERVRLQASYDLGFHAPSLAETARPAILAQDAVPDPLTCVGPPGVIIDCSVGPYPAHIVANPDLESERFRQFNLGLSWQAAHWLDLSANYFSARIDDRLTEISSSAIVRCLLGLEARCPSGLSNLPPHAGPPRPGLGLGLARDPVTQQILFIQRGLVNLGSLDVDGVDFKLHTTFDFGGWGMLNQQLHWSHIDRYRLNGSNQVDQPSKPGDRASLRNGWSRGDFSASWNIHYIASTRSTQAALIDDGFPDYGYGRRLPSWITHDLQASWHAPWNGRLTLGVTNLADKNPVLDPLQPTGRAYDFNLYDGYGRVPYVRYTQAF